MLGDTVFNDRILQLPLQEVLPFWWHGIENTIKKKLRYKPIFTILFLNNGPMVFHLLK